MALTETSMVEPAARAFADRVQRVLARHGLSAWLFYAPAAVIASLGVVAMLRSSVPFHADGFWVFSLAHDVQTGTPLRGWVMPGAPMYFPELVSIMLWVGLGFSAGATMLIHGLISWLIVGFTVCWGSCLAGASWARAARAAFMTLLMYVVVHGDSRALAEFQFPFSHGGAMLVSILGIVVLGRGVVLGWRWWSASCSAIVIGLVMASDRAALPQLIMPAFLTAAIFLVFRWAPKLHLVWTMGVLAAGAALGWALTGAVRWATGIELIPLAASYSWAASVDTFERAVNDVGEFAVKRPLVLASVILPVSLLFVFILERLPSALQTTLRGAPESTSSDRSGSFRWWVACYGMIVLAATIGGVLVTHRWNQRYILPVYVLPLAASAILWAPKLFQRRASIVRTLEVSLLMIVAVLATDKSKSVLPIDLYTPSYACLDRYVNQEGLHAGYAEYWYSRTPMVLSRSGITVAEVNGRLNPRRWVNNGFWYTRGYSPSAAHPPRYDFTLVNRLDKPWIQKRFGAPRAQESCFGLEIWVYDRPADFEFRNYLRTSLARDTGDQDGWWESMSIAAARGADGASIEFEGNEGTIIEFPHVPANVIELSSVTRKPLELIYRRAGVEVGRQLMEFKDAPRRLLMIPAPVRSHGFDSVRLQGQPGTRYELNEAAIMLDELADRETTAG